MSVSGMSCLQAASLSTLQELDALLADLQNTISPSGGSSGYGSLNGSGRKGGGGAGVVAGAGGVPGPAAGVGTGPRAHSPMVSSASLPRATALGADYATVNPVRNTTTTTTTSSVSHHHHHPHHPHPQTHPPHPPSTGSLHITPSLSPTYQNETGKMTSSLNNNLSELDTLLQDLSNSRYSERSRVDMNGSMVHSSPGRPSVDSLLDELNTAVPNGLGDHYVQKIMTEESTVTKISRPTASSATKELDDLMASLSDFKVSGQRQQQQQQSQHHHHHHHHQVQHEEVVHQQESTYAKPATRGKQKEAAHQLDCMLGSLQADMSRQGVTTTQKGCCGACDKPIVGQVITALGQTWHPEHFVCAHCNQELGTRNFFERDGRPYCEPDYHNLFSPRCAYCNGPILDKCVTALEKTWHTEHFFCAQCGKQFGEEGFHEKDGRPYCRDDYFDMFAPKCGGCNRPIMENYVSALSSQWHTDCFVCRDCRQPFHGGSFFDHEGLPYCETHYHAKRGSLCAGCHKPITGRCITAMFRKFHPEHFVCAFCLKQLNKGTFKEQNDKPYCHACFEKLFG